MATPIIPRGFRFEPTDEELIWYYLYPKTMNFDLEWIWIAEKQLYGDNAEPSIIFADDIDDSSPYWTTKEEGGVTKRTIYVFTKVTKTSANSKRNSRRAGSGTWMGQTGPKDIIDSRVGNVIGHTRMLTYQKKGNDDPNHWIMHEYTLAGAGLEAIGERRNDTVMCKITKFVKKSELRRNQVSLSPPPPYRFGTPLLPDFYFPTYPPPPPPNPSYQFGTYTTPPSYQFGTYPPPPPCQFGTQLLPVPDNMEFEFGDPLLPPLFPPVVDRPGTSTSGGPKCLCEDLSESEATSSTAPDFTPIYAELQDDVLQSNWMDTLNVLGVEDDFHYLAAEQIEVPAELHGRQNI